MKLGIKSRTIASYGALLLVFIALLLFIQIQLISAITGVVLAFAATGFIAYLAVSRLVGPLEEITTTVYEMAGGILEKEIMVQAPNEEIDELATSINFMAKQLRQNMTNINEERSRAKAILDSMGDGVIAIDCTGRVIMVNPALERTFKVNQNTSLGKQLIKVVRNYELDELLHTVLEEKQPVSREVKFLMPNPRVFRIHATPLKANASTKGGVVALMRDVTERRQLESMRSEFVANVSHELRTPLTSIKGFSETLLDGAMDDPETARHFLNIINAEADRLTRLINDLLNLSKLEDKRTVLIKQTLHIKDIIDQVAEIFAPQGHVKGITLGVSVPKELPTVQGERDLIFQVVVNLVDNAIKYTPSGGKVDITAARDKDYITVSVHDTGPGIPLEDLPRVFERFYRVDKARTRDAGGTGLGLAIAKHVIELHDGKISAENTGKGSVFSFTLPLE